LTSDVENRRAGRWQSWPGYGAFWKRLLRHVARQPEPSLLSLTADRRDDSIAVRADLVGSDGRYVTGAKLTATVAGPDGESRMLDLAPIAPGRYAAAFPIGPSAPAEYEIRVRGESTDPPMSAALTVFVDYPDELQLRDADEDLLRRVATTTGGAFLPDPASVFALDGRTVDRVRPLWSYLLTAALLLFVVDVALRRLRF
jgi:hypothetical protein